MTNQEAGAVIKKKRRAKGWTQKQLAAMLCISNAAVSKWETGVNYPDLQHIIALSMVLDIPVEDFFIIDPVSMPDVTPVVAEPESASDILASDLADAIGTLPQTQEPESSEARAAPPQTEPAESEQGFPIKRMWLRIATAVSLFAILLSGTIAIVHRVQADADGIPAFTIAEEYYGVYEGDMAYYLIVEYTAEPTTQTILEYSEALRKTYSGFFNDCSAIVIAFYKRNSFHNEMDIDNSADYSTILYPINF